MTIRQHKMMTEEIGKGVSIERAMELNQVVFGSIAYQRWIKYDVTVDRFVLTLEGRSALAQITDWSAYRKNNNHHLSARADSLVHRRRKAHDHRNKVGMNL